jgi:hypothetical protein
MFLLVVFQIVAMSLNCQPNGQGLSDSVMQYEVVMYAGFPPEDFPGDERKRQPAEKPLLVAPVETNGRFAANKNDVMFEGTMSTDKDRKFVIRIDRSSLGSTSCPKINGLVKVGEPLKPTTCAFSSIIFAYYFKVRIAHNPSLDLSGGGVYLKMLYPFDRGDYPAGRTDSTVKIGIVQ